ncbi:hypothetical protein [Dyadobacter frigoris]|uniref:LysM domain-containing protein n=1 Tax=Dyadobacter frigoris TaxID=2576211 RepID=A0A4U6D042_9BACT|nr:hypothetical protein [Dyadobacter frigoris]TKT89467.1 hypothetical protein FDK13_24300 [Dyadobacter frigoris]
MKKYIVTPGQSLFDVAIIVYGDVTGVAFLIIDNGLNGPVDRIYEGQVLLYRDNAINLRQKVYLNDYTTIATIDNLDKPEGIGFWSVDEYLIPGIQFEQKPIFLDNERIYFILDHEGNFLTKITNLSTGTVLTNQILEYLDSFGRARGFFVVENGDYLVEIEGYLTAHLIINTL